MKIRPATLDDTEARVQVHNASRPDNQITLETALHSEKIRKEDLIFQRFAAEVDSKPVAFAYYSQIEWMFHPQKFDMGVLVHPYYRKRGIGAALYDTLIENLQPYNPTRLSGFAREDWHDSIKFVESRGFEVAFREWESRLNMATFNASKFAGSIEKVEALGYTLCSLADLSFDSNALRKVYDIDVEVSDDMPLPPGETLSPMTFERWQERVETTPNFSPETWFVAVAPDGDVVGVSMLYKRSADNELDTGLTGVKRAHRRKGIALALKLKGLEYARSYGAPIVRTFNAQNNQKMLPINKLLGFEKQPGWLEYAKVIKD